MSKTYEHDGCVGCKYEHFQSTSSYCQGCKQNAADKYTIPTNADKIRQMTSEELAEIIMCPYGSSELPCSRKDNCIDCCLDWLESEVEYGA